MQSPWLTALVLTLLLTTGCASKSSDAALREQLTQTQSALDTTTKALTLAQEQMNNALAAANNLQSDLLQARTDLIATRQFLTDTLVRLQAYEKGIAELQAKLAAFSTPTPQPTGGN